MATPKSDLRAVMERFRQALSACREIADEGRVEMFDRDNVERSLGWMIFFRAMNLSEAAVLCAEARLGEAVWLTTRCLQELAYLTKSLGAGLEKACTFLAADAHKHARWLEKRSGDLPGSDVGLRESFRRAAELQRQQLPPEPPDWPDQVKKRAQEAKMGSDHALIYYFFSDLAHHGHRSFDVCNEECRDGIQINSRMLEKNIVVGLFNGAYYWKLVVDPLFSLLGLKVTPRLKRAFGSLKRDIGATDAEQ